MIDFEALKKKDFNLLSDYDILGGEIVKLKGLAEIMDYLSVRSTRDDCNESDKNLFSGLCSIIEDITLNLEKSIDLLDNELELKKKEEAKDDTRED